MDVGDKVRKAVGGQTGEVAAWTNWDCLKCFVKWSDGTTSWIDAANLKKL